MKFNEFTDQKETIEWVACDTETYTYIDGELLTEQEIENLADKNGQAWMREHTSVEVYAWLVSDGQRFAWLESFNEFTEFCANHSISACWWYNAKFDFACIDYDLLTQGWQETVEGRMKNHTYKSLHGRMGQRYSLSLCVERIDKSRHRRNHITRHYDLCNIFGGGLAKILEKFNVTDFDGKPIRKLEMDYQSTETTWERVAYMKNDVHGLYHAVRMADVTIRDACGLKIAGKKPEAMTASGIAKKVFLMGMYPQIKTHTERCKQYQRDHKTGWYGVDKYYRDRYIYRGGIAFLNPRYQGKLIKKRLWRLDYNSHYPAQIATMVDIVSHPRRELYPYKAKQNEIVVVEIQELFGSVRPNMLPLFYDPIARKYTAMPDYRMGQNKGRELLMFEDELNELNEWYDLDVLAETCLVFRTKDEPAYREYVKTFYEMKATAKKDEDEIRYEFSKLLNNGLGGKFGENPHKPQCHRVLSKETGAVTIEDDPATIDEKCIMNVLQGALMMSMARTKIMHDIRAICPCPARDFVYMDTDSIHCLVEPPHGMCDPYELGRLKDETIDKPVIAFKYLAPKTYVDITDDGLELECKVHTKGIPTSVVKRSLKGKKIDTIDKIFAVGATFTCLTAMNVVGGKALIPTKKELCRVENQAQIIGTEYLITED